MPMILFTMYWKSRCYANNEIAISWQPKKTNLQCIVNCLVKITVTKNDVRIKFGTNIQKVPTFIKNIWHQQQLPLLDAYKTDKSHNYFQEFLGYRFKFLFKLQGFLIKFQKFQDCFDYALWSNSTGLKGFPGAYHTVSV